MALAETQQLRMLERLRSAGQQPVTLDQLRAGGIDFPAGVIGELELNGYAIERVYEHGRQIGVRRCWSPKPLIYRGLASASSAATDAAKRVLRSALAPALAATHGAPGQSSRKATIAERLDDARL